MLPQKNGTYLAKVKTIAIDQKDTGVASVNIAFDLVALQLANTETEDVTGQYITGYFNIVTKAGKLNDINIRSLRESLGWGGTSFEELQSGQFEGVECQVVIDTEVYNGKESLRVKYINPKDYAGGTGLKRADYATIKSLDAKFGSMLRASASSMPAGSAAKKAVGAAATNGAAGSPPSIGKEMAWKSFTDIIDQHNKNNADDLYTETDRKEVFKKIVTEAAAPKKTAELSPEDWAGIEKEIKTKFSAASRDLIPF